MKCTLLLVFGLGAACAPGVDGWTESAFEKDQECSADPLERAAENREKAKEMFQHAYNGYMDYAFPWDELKPLSCSGRRWDKRERGTIDDVLGGFALTLVDSLDSLAVLGLVEEFESAVVAVVEHVHFDRDVTVSLFETTIRVLGGLLSAHLLIVNGTLPFSNSFQYENELLNMAEDLGTRLMPAFETDTGIPYHRINLRNGVERTETVETCTAAAGTLLVEFGLLSRLSGDRKYERAARRAVMELWDRRSMETGLLGNTINIATGQWLSLYSGTGPGIDSYFEYLLKAHVLLDDPGSPYYRADSEYPTGDRSLLKMFLESLEAIDANLSFGPWQIEVNMKEGKSRPRNYVVSSLQAFWPGMEALLGNVARADKMLGGFFLLWKHFGLLPESFDLMGRSPPQFGKNFFLRPEIIESTMFLYEKTSDPKYLEMGEDMMLDLERFCRTECGFAAINDVTAQSWEKEDRMDSFLLSETFKYLYMLFDMGARKSAQPTVLTKAGEKVLFSTEGHVFVLPSSSILNSPKLLQWRAAFMPSNPSLRNVNQTIESSKTGSRRGIKSKKPRKFSGTVSLDAVLSPFLQAPIHIPPYTNKVSAQTFPLSTAEFGSSISKKNLHSTRFVVIKAVPFDGCSALKNTKAIASALKHAQDLRVLTNNAEMQVAVMVERGGCSFVHKASMVANMTDARVVFVLNTEELDGGNEVVYNMVDDGTARSRGPRLSQIAVYMAPRSFGQMFEGTLLQTIGVPDLERIHISHHVIVHVSEEDGQSDESINIGLPVGMPVTQRGSSGVNSFSEAVWTIFSLLFSP